MIYVMILIFVAGYVFIAMEHTTKVNKASVALLIGTLLWVIYVYLAPGTVLNVSPDAFNHYIDSHADLQHHPFAVQVRHFVIDHQILESIGDIAEMLFFLLAAKDFTGNAALGTFAGFEGIFCGSSAIYLAMAEVLNEKFGRTILPIGEAQAH